MAYEKTTWVDGETPISAENLNKMEEGIVEASQTGGILEGTIVDYDGETVPEGYEEVEDDEVDGILTGSVIGFNGDTIPEGYKEVSGKSFVQVYGNAYTTTSTGEETIPLTKSNVNVGNGFEVLSDGTVKVKKKIYCRAIGQTMLTGGSTGNKLLMVKRNGQYWSYDSVSNLATYKTLRTISRIMELQENDIISLSYQGAKGDVTHDAQYLTFLNIEEL